MLTLSGALVVLTATAGTVRVRLLRVGARLTDAWAVSVVGLKPVTPPTPLVRLAVDPAVPLKTAEVAAPTGPLAPAFEEE